MRPLRSLALSAVVVGSLGLPPTPQAERPLLRVSTDLVTLAVTVVDRHGAFVDGLNREQFRVYDNGLLQQVEFFSAEDVPATVGLVIDSSASMRSRRAEVTVAGTSFAAMSHPLDEYFTVNFNEQAWLGLPPGVAFVSDAAALREALAAAPAAGMTALFDAVDLALGHLERGTRHRTALAVVSDGGDNASGHILASILERARRTSAVIYTVAVADPDDDEADPGVLRRLARETGGRAFEPKRPGEVTAAFAQIAREIRTAYMIGFSPAATGRGGFHSIRVVVDAPGPLTARTRAGYYAPGD